MTPNWYSHDPRAVPAVSRRHRVSSRPRTRLCNPNVEYVLPMMMCGVQRACSERTRDLTCWTLTLKSAGFIGALTGYSSYGADDFLDMIICILSILFSCFAIRLTFFYVEFMPCIFCTQCQCQQRYEGCTSPPSFIQIVFHPFCL